MVQQNVSLNEKEVKRPVLNDGITLTNIEKNKFETYADDFEGNENIFVPDRNEYVEKNIAHDLNYCSSGMYMIGFRIIFRLSHRIRH